MALANTHILFPTNTGAVKIESKKRPILQGQNQDNQNSQLSKKNKTESNIFSTEILATRITPTKIQEKTVVDYGEKTSKKRPIFQEQNQDNQYQHLSEFKKIERDMSCVTPTSVSGVILADRITPIEIQEKKLTLPLSESIAYSLMSAKRIDKKTIPLQPQIKPTGFKPDIINDSKKTTIHDISLNEDHHELMAISTQDDFSSNPLAPNRVTPNKFLTSTKTSPLTISKPIAITTKKQVSLMLTIDESDSDEDSLGDEFSITDYESDNELKEFSEEDELAGLFKLRCEVDTSKMFGSAK